MGLTIWFGIFSRSTSLHVDIFRCVGSCGEPLRAASRPGNVAGIAGTVDSTRRGLILTRQPLRGVRWRRRRLCMLHAIHRSLTEWRRRLLRLSLGNWRFRGRHRGHRHVGTAITVTPALSEICSYFPRSPRASRSPQSIYDISAPTRMVRGKESCCGADR